MQNLNNKKRFISGIVLFLLVFNLVEFSIFFSKKVYALDAEITADPFVTEQSSDQKLREAARIAREQAEKVKESWAAIAFKAVLHTFLQRLAIDTATWVATGGKGQKPMFITKGWGPYLLDAADQAAGTFIMTAANEWDRHIPKDDMGLYQECMNEEEESCIGKCSLIYVDSEYEFLNSINDDCVKECINEGAKYCEEGLTSPTSPTTAGSIGRNYGKGTIGSITKFLCEPDMRVKLKITAGLTSIERPRAPKCTMSEARRNWDTFVNDPNFLQRFQSYWDPWENDVGIALTMHSNFLADKGKVVNEAIKKRIEGDGFESVTNKIGKILTPAYLVKMMGRKPIEEGTEMEKVNTTDIVANAIGTFAHTLMGKLLDKWISKGLVSSGDDDSSYNWADYISGSTSATRAKEKNKVKTAKERYMDVFKPYFNQGSAYSILKELITCPDPQNVGPDECVIDENFSTAIQERLTVQEAINRGYINTEVPFGFINGGLEPEYNQGYPYRSLLILRKYRIIPVGWEIAANYIGSFNNKTFNIQEIINGFDDSNSSFYRLIDPSWVLKAPELFCAVEGYGEQLVSQEVIDGYDSNEDEDYNDDGEISPKVALSRNKYCADERSCIEEDDQGNCLFYGYCSEEKREWNFNGEECDSHYNTCQNFIDPEGKEFFYVKKSLKYDGCNAENAGCKWYCISGDLAGEGWMCSSPGIDYISSTLCLTPDGCSITDVADIDQDGDDAEVCTVPFRGISCQLDDSRALLFMGDINDIVSRVNNDIYFDSDTKECKAREEGCHEYIRTKPNLGTNLLSNSSFEIISSGDVFDDGVADIFINWTVMGSEAITTESFTGNASLQSLAAGGALDATFDSKYSIGERKFIFSFYAKDCTNAVNFQIAGGPIETLEQTAYWQRFTTSYSANLSQITVSITNMNAGCLIDAAQLEEVIGLENSPSNYSGYQTNNLAYLKKAPFYYHCEDYTVFQGLHENKTDCENNGYLWRDDIERCVMGGSPKCDDFAFECNTDDVGCDLYTPKNGDPSVPAIVASNDFCPEECNGYDTYKQENTFFESEKFPEFLIPDNEKKCSARYAGCSEFTNLDRLEEGGEAIEYYTYLRPCQDINNDCKTFYTWVGSEITGFQLKSFLLRDVDGANGPDSIFDKNENGFVDLDEIDPEEIFGACVDFDDAVSNPECYEFYTETGDIFYHHYKDSMTCSDDCHPFRKTRSTKDDCTSNWGIWRGDDGNNPDVDPYFCVYESLAEESIKCPSAQNNCYEYKGNTSNNIRKVIDDDFEQAENVWGTTIPNSLTLSSESLVRGGHSLQVDGSDMSYDLKLRCNLGSACVVVSNVNPDGCECQIDGETVCYLEEGEQTCIYKDLIRSGKTYLFSFWAKGNGALTARFSSAPVGDEFADGNIALSPEWAQYSLGPVFIHDDWDMSSDDPGVGGAGSEILEYLEITGFGGMSYIDNITLKEVRDYMFLIRPDFWHIPLVCDQDYNNNPAPQYMLGCKEYKSKIEKKTVYLKSFDHLCSEDVVGCEALIDTFNSSNFLEEIFNLGDTSEITVPADDMIFLVNSKNKSCKAKEKGCVAVGEAQYRYNMHLTPSDRGDDTDDLYQYKTRYYINDPDKYNEILCQSGEVECNEYDSILGKYHFKDPYSQRIKTSPRMCEYKNVKEQLNQGWYIKGTDSGMPNCPVDFSETGVIFTFQACLGGTNNGDVCIDDNDCFGGACLNWSAECPGSADTCTEYLDPLSTISKNLVFNADFVQDVDEDGVPDGWEPYDFDQDGNDDSYILEEPIFLYHNNVYTLMGEATSAGTYNVILQNCSNSLTSPDTSLDITVMADPEGNGVQLPFLEAGRFSGRFYVGYDTHCEVVVTDNLEVDGTMAVYETGIYYNLDNSINKTDCNGFVDYNNGCVLFNSREMQNQGLVNELIYDADLNDKINNTPAPADPATVCSASGCEDSNLLVKVRPDRDCGEWLYCKSLVKSEDNDGNERQMCLEIGLCDSLSEDGLCDGFPVTKRENQVFVDPNQFKNKSGFAKIGMNLGDIDFDSSDEIIPGYYPFEKMIQEGGKVLIPNGDFETFNNDNYPIGWKYEGAAYRSSYFSAIVDPISSQREGVGLYAPQGKSFLKIDASAHALSDKIDISFFNNSQGTMVTYYMDAYLNTRNLFGGKAQINVLSYTSTGALIGQTSVVSQDYGMDWEYLTDDFILVDSAGWLEIKIMADYQAEGSFYVDAINIRPVLEVATEETLENRPIVNVSQPNGLNVNLHVSYVTSETSAEFYNYNPSDASSEMSSASIIQEDRSELFVHVNSNTDVMAVGWIHDAEYDDEITPDGGEVEFIFDWNLITAGAMVSVEDDPFATTGDDDPDFNESDILPDFSYVDNIWWTHWSGCCTDGGMIDMPLGDWTITIEPNFDGPIIRPNGNPSTAFGIDQWVFASPDGMINLDMNEPVTISYTTGDQVLDDHVSQSCRAYPKQNSLACEYLDDKGIKNIGWKGFCLEYDRPPGNPDQCLMWWPVDLLLGEGSNEEETGYRGKFPVYYCDDTVRIIGFKGDWLDWLQTEYCGGRCCGFDIQSNRLVAWEQSDEPSGWSGGGCSDTPHNIFPPHWSLGGSVGGSNACGGNCPAAMWSIPIPTPVFDTPDGYDWYLYSDFAPFLDMPGTGYIIEHDNTHRFSVVLPAADLLGHVNNDQRYMCNNLVQTVTSTGQNKYWSNRVFEGSDYIVPFLSDSLRQYRYDSFDTPFGSILNLDPDNDPSQWIFDEFNNYPLIMLHNKDITDDSLPHSFGQDWGGMGGNNSYLSRLFAQSYGNWQWSASTLRYEEIMGSNWIPPNTLCSGNPPARPRYDPSTLTCNGGDCLSGCGGNPVGPTCDWCGVSPRIENIKMNEQSNGNYIINNSGTVEIAFNTVVDINQSPLVMYVVDWGDGTDTNPNFVLGSGISINHKPNPDNPHSFYHLYGYWDMLNKDTQSSSIECGGDGESLFGGSVACQGVACCATNINIKIKDNWGWCNDGTNRNDCNEWQNYNGYVVVNQYGFNAGCSTICPTGPGCRSVQPANTQIFSNIGECCGNGSCYECIGGYVWDFHNGGCVIDCQDDCAVNEVGCFGTVPWTCVLQAADNCYDQISGADCSLTGQTCSYGSCGSCSNNCSGTALYQGDNYEVTGCVPLGTYSNVTNGIFSYLTPSDSYCCNASERCYACPLGEIWDANNQVCVVNCDPSCVGIACGELNACGQECGGLTSTCAVPCQECNLVAPGDYECQSPAVLPAVGFYIDDTNGDGALTTGEDITISICDSPGVTWSLQYNGGYLNASDCDNSSNGDLPLSDCRNPVPNVCDSWIDVYNGGDPCNLYSDGTWMYVSISAGGYYSSTETYQECCNLCSGYSNQFRFFNEDDDVTATPAFVIDYNNDDCSCEDYQVVQYNALGGIVGGCNSHVWLENYTPGNTGDPLAGDLCDLYCSGHWQVDETGWSSCCNDSSWFNCILDSEFDWVVGSC